VRGALAAAALAGAALCLAACGGRARAAGDPGGGGRSGDLAYVDLKLFAVGDASLGSEAVIEAVNKRLGEKLNTHLSVEYLPWANWESRYQLVFASGEAFDAIYTAIWSFYATQATKNGFLRITKPMLEQYAPAILNDMPEAAWKQALIDGRVYMIPTTYDEYSATQIAIRGDLRTKHGLPEVNSLESLEAYLRTIATKETGIIPAFPNDHWGLLLNSYGEMDAVVGGGYLFYYDIGDPESKVFNLYETGRLRDHVEMMHRFQGAGYFPKNALTDRTEPQQKFENGQIASFVYNLGTIDSANTNIRREHPEWAVEVIDGTFGRRLTKTPSNNSGLGIHVTSENPERVLMVADYARSDRVLNNLFCYGVEGTHWTDAGEGLWRSGPSPDYSDGLGWIFRNSAFQKLYADSHPQIVDLQRVYSDRTVVPALQSFIFDDGPLKNEMAALDSVRTQYADPLSFGYVDPRTGLPELTRRLREAGVERVEAELRKQVASFLEGYNRPVW
jgi:putative aldouronate transport system substrate-binding protein